MEVRALRPSTIQAWLKGRSEYLRPATVRAVHSHLVAILSAAVDDSLIAKSPCAARSVRPPVRDREKLVPWPEDQVKAVIKALEDQYQAIAVLAAGCGLRRGELFGVAVEDVDFLRGIVHVRRQVKLVGNRRVFAPPKGGKERDVPLPESIAFMIAAALKSHPAREVTLPWKMPTGESVTARLMFTNSSGQAIHRSTFDQRVWKPALVAAGVVPDLRTPAPADGLHALRHYYASALLADGVDVRTLSEQLGHSDPGFTSRTYTHLMPSSAERTRAAIDRVFRAAVSAPDMPQIGR
jgi:integrase